MDVSDATVNVLLLHAHSLISSEDPHHGMELDKPWSKSWAIRRSAMASPYEYVQCLELGRAKNGCYDQTYWKEDSNSFLEHQRMQPRSCSLTCQPLCPQYQNPHHPHQWKLQSHEKVTFIICTNSHFMQLRKMQVQCSWTTQIKNRYLWKQHHQPMRWRHNAVNWKCSWYQGSHRNCLLTLYHNHPLLWNHELSFNQSWLQVQHLDQMQTSQPLWPVSLSQHRRQQMSSSLTIASAAMTTIQALITMTPVMTTAPVITSATSSVTTITPATTTMMTATATSATTPYVTATTTAVATIASTPVIASITPPVTPAAATTTATMSQPQVLKIVIMVAKLTASIIATQMTTTTTSDVTSQTTSATDTQAWQTHSQQQQQPDPQPTTVPDTPSRCTRVQAACSDDLQPSTAKDKKDSSKSTSKTMGSTTPATTPQTTLVKKSKGDDDNTDWWTRHTIQGSQVSEMSHTRLQGNKKIPVYVESTSACTETSPGLKAQILPLHDSRLRPQGQHKNQWLVAPLQEQVSRIGWQVWNLVARWRRTIPTPHSSGGRYGTSGWQTWPAGIVDWAGPRPTPERAALMRNCGHLYFSFHSNSQHCDFMSQPVTPLFFVTWGFLLVIASLFWFQITPCPVVHSLSRSVCA